MNNVILIGRLTKDPTFYAEDTKRAKYILAINQYFSGTTRTEYVPCTLFGANANFANAHLKKGMRICVRGRIHTSFYDVNLTKTKTKRVYATEIIVDEQEFADGKANQIA